MSANANIIVNEFLLMEENFLLTLVIHINDK